MKFLLQIRLGLQLSMGKKTSYIKQNGKTCVQFCNISTYSSHTKEHDLGPSREQDLLDTQLDFNKRPNNCWFTGSFNVQNDYHLQKWRVG